MQLLLQQHLDHCLNHPSDRFAEHVLCLLNSVWNTRVLCVRIKQARCTCFATQKSPKAYWSRCLRNMQVSLCWWSVNCCVQACKQTQRDTQGKKRAKCAHVGDTNNTVTMVDVGFNHVRYCLHLDPSSIRRKSECVNIVHESGIPHVCVLRVRRWEQQEDM